MGEPAIPTPQERAERRALARRIVDAVRNDEEFPYDGGPLPDGYDAEKVYQLERIAFGLAQELVMREEHARDGGVFVQCDRCRSDIAETIWDSLDGCPACALSALAPKINRRELHAALDKIAGIR